MSTLTKREQFALAIYCASIQSPCLEKILAGAAKEGMNLPAMAIKGADDLLAGIEASEPKK